MKVGIIGAGLIGKKRAEAIHIEKIAEIVAICDVEVEKASVLTGLFGGKAVSDWRRVLEDPSVEAVVVATPNCFLGEITIAALKNGKHVLCEKPLGRNATEAEAMRQAAREAGRVLKTGFNHRHHPAIRQARERAGAGEIGELYFARCVYGHGGRPGYEKEWRASREICGGGELLDQGVHVVDLFRWFMGDFDEVFGRTATYYWPMEVEDNAFALFRTADGRTAQMHTSWTQWKNKFLLEIIGEKGYLVVDGLGGSYGPEKLIIGKRKTSAQVEGPGTEGSPLFLGGAPNEEIIEFPGPDISWREEIKEFASAIRENREPIGSGYDGLMANRMIGAVYESAKINRPVEIQAG
jgi:predicted dehydrogenase